MPRPAAVLGLAATGLAAVGIASVPHLLGRMVCKELPAPPGRFKVGSLVRRDAAGFLVRLFYPVTTEAAEAGGGPARWLPEPAALYVQGVGAFMNLPRRAAAWLLGALFQVRHAAMAERKPFPGRSHYFILV